MEHVNKSIDICIFCMTSGKLACLLGVHFYIHVHACSIQFFNSSKEVDSENPPHRERDLKKKQERVAEHAASQVLFHCVATAFNRACVVVITALENSESKKCENVLEKVIGLCFNVALAFTVLSPPHCVVARSFPPSLYCSLVLSPIIVLQPGPFPSHCIVAWSFSRSLCCSLVLSPLTVLQPGPFPPHSFSPSLYCNWVLFPLTLLQPGPFPRHCIVTGSFSPSLCCSLVLFPLTVLQPGPSPPHCVVARNNLASDHHYCG